MQSKCDWVEQTGFYRCVGILAESEIKIGGTPDCAILLMTESAKNDSVTLRRNADGLVLSAAHTNGIVEKNASAVQGDVPLYPMDFFFFAGAGFYFRSDCLYISNAVSVKIQGLQEIQIEEQASAMPYPTFVRSVRVQHQVEEGEIEVLSPKEKQEVGKENMLMRILPTMGSMLAMLMMRGSGGGSGITFLLYTAVTVGVSVGTGAWTTREKKKELATADTDRKEKYLSYIKSKVDQILASRQDELRVLHRIYRPMDDNVATVSNFDKGLFDRSAEDSDFLDVRIGVGKQKAKVQIRTSKMEDKDTTDDLMDIPSEIESKYWYLEDAPVVASLKEANAIGVVGSRRWLYETLKNMVLDLAVRQYYKELKIYFVFSEAEMEQFAWLRWLQNCHMDDSTIRTILCDEDSTKYHLESLYKILSDREENTNSHSNANWPTHYVVIAYRIDPIRNHPVSQYFERSANLGFHFVFMDEHEELIPRGCSQMIRLDRKECRGSIIQTNHGEQITEFKYSPISDRLAREMVKKLCPIHVVESSLESEMSKYITLFELLGIQSIRNLNLTDIWNTSRVDKSMAAPLGVKTKNEMVALDLHEKAHGPHGLVAGTTGSGKSEIMQSYILSMSLKFHPHEVGFLIIDFKGGGMVNQFEKLPHLIGAITNIDGREIDRSLKSIKAELLRRQGLFAQYDVNRIDAYILLHKKEPERVPIPLPHLIIIVDEFAELKAEQPDFMKELISAARIGRSLGVHLILATQKPSGVVDDQIWSNSKFKLCLKVQTKEDSQEVLKTPLAAEIREPGRAYLQVGNNEIFELFQSAYSGADVPDESASAQKHEKIYELNVWGNRKVVYDNKQDKQKEADSQLTALVNYVHDYCADAGIAELPNICLPPLEQSFALDHLSKTVKNLDNGIVASVAKYDDPEQQYQGDYWLNLSDTNILLIGSSQMGKTTALQTILYSCIMQYTPKEVVFYVIDAGNMALKVFENAKHVGGVALLQEEERIANLFKMLQEKVQERKAIFAEHGIGTYKAYIEAGLRELPQIVLVIDNVAAFREYYEDFNEKLQVLSREGTSVGITLLVTGTQSISIGYKTLANFGTRVVFTCNESGEYSNLLGRCRMEPYEYPGRALVLVDKRVVEAQFALCVDGEKEIERMDKLKVALLENAAQYQGIRVQKIPEVSESLTLQEAINEMPTLFQTPRLLPIGMDYSSVAYHLFDPADAGYLALSGKEGSGKSEFSRMLIHQLERLKDTKPSVVYVVDHPKRKLVDTRSISSVVGYTVNPDEATDMVDQVFEEMERRKAELESLEDVQEQIRLSESWPLVVFIIQNAKVFDHINATPDASGKIAKLISQYRDCNICFVFGDFPNAQIGFGAGELLKYVRSNMCLLFFENVSNLRIFDLSMRQQREFSKPITPGDAHLCVGDEILRLKTISDRNSL